MNRHPPSHPRLWHLPPKLQLIPIPLATPPRQRIHLDHIPVLVAPSEEEDRVVRKRGHAEIGDGETLDTAVDGHAFGLEGGGGGEGDGEDVKGGVGVRDGR